MQHNTKRLTESAMLLSLAVVLETVSRMFIPPMTFGGQVTLASMLPAVLIAYRHGVRWGLVSGFCYGLMEMALGAGTVTAAFQPGFFGEGRMLLNALIMCILDYLAAFTVLGLSVSYIPMERLLWSLLSVVLSGQIIGWIQKFPSSKRRK